MHVTLKIGIDILTIQCSSRPIPSSQVGSTWTNKEMQCGPARIPSVQAMHKEFSLQAISDWLAQEPDKI